MLMARIYLSIMTLMCESERTRKAGWRPKPTAYGLTVYRLDNCIGLCACACVRLVSWYFVVIWSDFLVVCVSIISRSFL